MSALPEQYRKYAAPPGQPAVHPHAIELYEEHDPIVLVPDPDNVQGFVRVRQSSLQRAIPTPPRDLAPQPLLDPTAQRLVGGGIGGGVLLWGGGQFLIGAGQLVSGLSGMGALLFFLALAGARAGFGRAQGGTRVEVHNHVRGFGRSTTNL
jgi:hypothetical protein